MTEKIFEHLRQHKPIIVNYGKGYFTDKDVKEPAYYDEKIQKYRSKTGIWSNKLLKEIANNEVENTLIELGE